MPGVMIAMKITHVFRTITVTRKVEESVLDIFVQCIIQMEALPNKIKQVAEQMPNVSMDYVFHHLNWLVQLVKLMKIAYQKKDTLAIQRSCNVKLITAPMLIVKKMNFASWDSNAQN